MKRHQGVSDVSSPTLQMTVALLSLAFASVVVLSFVLEVDVIARGSGRVLPDGRVQSVQTEYDGTVKKILVEDGSEVYQGQALIELDRSEADLRLKTLRAEKDRLMTERGRIETLLRATVDTVDGVSEPRSVELVVADSLRIHPYYLEQVELLGAEMANIQALLEQYRARTHANVNLVGVTAAKIRQIETSRVSQERRVRIAERLWKKRVGSQADYVDEKAILDDLNQQRRVLVRELEQQESVNHALRAESKRTVTLIREELTERNAEIAARLEMLADETFSANRRLKATALVAPVDGYVDQLQVFTIGAVAEAGQELLRVIPKDVEFEVRAEFANSEIGFVKEGQDAIFKLDAYPAERFGHIKGKVSDVSADSVEVSDKRWVYSVSITPDAFTIGAGDQARNIRAGMTGWIDIKTDRRRIISYFFAPILKTVQGALSER